VNPIPKLLSGGRRHDAITVVATAEPTSPLILSLPHSGEVYPDDFGASPGLPHAVLDYPNDKYVDELYAAAAPLGFSVVKANFPRAYVDVNRHQHDIDPAMIADPDGWYARLQPTAVEGGSTLFWSLAKERPIYDRKIGHAEAKSRIARCYVPYHQAMTVLIEAARDRFGAAYVVDCHSMMRFDPSRRGSAERPEIDVGTRHGESCATAFGDCVADAFAARGIDVGRNKRFSGGEIALRYGWPEIDQHVVQIEIRRDLYMNEETRARHAGFDALRRHCTGVLEDVKAFVTAALAQRDGRRIDAPPISL
jgi:N-formylglutamate amidohydrolase